MLKPSRAGDPGPDRDVSLQAERRFRVVLADDHPDVREEIRQLLTPDFDVLLTVPEGIALVNAVADLKPDVVVSDIHMPKMDGIEAARRLLSAGLCEAIVLLSMYPDAHLVDTAMATGIRGYVLKLDANEELIPAIHAAVRGECYLSQGVRDRNCESTRNF